MKGSLQAWVRAVQTDSTFIVFHSGNFERIGFRHRANQTLYLSELIDVVHGKDPAYGRLHIGLHMAIIQDVLDRMHQQIKLEAEGAPKLRSKRRRGTLVSSDAKRPKTRAFSVKEIERVANERENYKVK